MRSLAALTVQVPAATPRMVPVFPLPGVKLQAPTGVAVTEKVTVCPDGATALTSRLPPISKSGKVEGVRTGLFANREVGATTVCKLDGSDRGLLPTMFVATTFTV